jgi:protein-tyrosine-phosphatase
MAQALLSSLLSHRGVDAQVASAGTLPAGFPLPQETQDALRGLGFDASPLQAYRSRQLDDGLVNMADLVLGLAREHVREVVVRNAEAWEKSFTLKELIRLGEKVGPRRRNEELSEWLARVGNGRNRNELLGASEVDDVIDPAGGLPSGFVHTAGEIQALCVSLADLLWS